MSFHLNFFFIFIIDAVAYHITNSNTYNLDHTNKAFQQNGCIGYASVILAKSNGNKSQIIGFIKQSEIEKIKFSIFNN